MKRFKMKGKMLLVMLVPYVLLLVSTLIISQKSLGGIVEQKKLLTLYFGIAINAVVVLIGSYIVVRLVVNNMVQSVNRMVTTLVYVIKGDLTQELDERDLSRYDELGMLAMGVDKVRATLKDIVGKIESTTQVLSETSEKLDQMSDATGKAANEVANAMGDMSSGAMLQAEDTQKVNDEVDAMSNMIVQTHDEVEKLNLNSAQMKEAGEQGFEIVQSLQNISEKVQSEIEIIREQTNVTNESAQKIRQATELIASIASETNLLSLNASIEAARAGESGRGFAVVAEQIKNLSDQSNDSVTSIDEIIGGLIEDSEKAVATMERVNEIIKRQNDEVNKTRAAFEVVNERLIASASEVNKIAENTNTIEQSKDVVVDAMSNLSSVAEENAATTEETAASTEELTATIGEIAEQAAQLHSLAESLTEEISMFRLA